MLYSKLIIIALNFLDYFQQKKIIKLINSKFSKPIVVFDIGAHYGETIKLFLNKLICFGTTLLLFNQNY